MSATKIPIAIFRIGKIVATKNALDRLCIDDITEGIAKHQAGDWGEISEEDRQANDRGLIQKTRLFSAHHSARGIKFWIITDANRSVTKVLLPGDY